MKARDAAKLLGGYATGTLTEGEREALFTAALDDQELFDALADEQALRDLLADPVARARLAAALEESRPAFAAWWQRPVWRVAAASFAVVVMAVALVRMGSTPGNRAVMAELRQAPAPALLPPPPQNAPAAEHEGRPGPPRERRPAGAPATARALDAGGSEAKKAAAPAVEVAPPPPVAPQTTPMADQAMPMAALELAQRDTAQKDTAEAPARVRRETAASGGAMAPARAATLSRTGFVASEPAPVRWRVLGGESANRIDAAAARATVGTTEPFRIEVTPAAPGWVYILEPDGAGGWRQAAGGEASPDKPLRFPASGNLEFDEPGRKVWRAVYSSVPLSVPASRTGVVIQIEVVRR